MDERGGADVHPPRRLAREQHRRGAGDLASHHDLLLVAAGEPRGREEGQQGAHVEALHESPRVLDDRPPPHQRAAVVAALAVAPEDGVLAGVELAHQAGALAVFRHMRQAHAARGGRAGGAAFARRGLAVDAHRARGDGKRPRHRFQEFGLAVPGDPGDADDLARAHGETHVSHPRDAVAVAHREALHLEQGTAPAATRVRARRRDRAADHRFGEAVGGGVGDLGMDRRRGLRA